MQYFDLAAGIAFAVCLGYIFFLSLKRVDPGALWLRISMIASAAGVLALLFSSGVHNSAVPWLKYILAIVAIGAAGLSWVRREPRPVNGQPDGLTMAKIGLLMTLSPFKPKKTNGENIG